MEASSKIEESSEIRNYYRDTTNIIKEKFYPHFNLYHKTFLQSKMDCFENNYKAPSSYYECVDKLDNKMSLNSDSLKKKLDAAEYLEKECQEKCQFSFTPEKPELKACYSKCASTLRDSCLSIYQSFYDQHLSAVSEYKKIPK